MTLTVTHVSDTTEYLNIGGTDVALTNGNSGTIAGIGSYSVAVATGTATVTLSAMTRDNTQMGTLINSITYRDSSQAPTTASNRVVTITGITDSGSSSNTASPNIAATVTVAAVNDAPTGLGNLTLTAVNEDTASPSGAAISSLTGLSFSDPDAGSASLGGVAVVGNTANSGTQGVWQYSTNAGTNWFDIGTVADDSTALALSAATLVRFVPVADYNGTPTALTVRALDNTNATGYSTTAGTEARVTLNASVNGGTTAISTNTNTIGTSITAVNDVPVRTAGSLSAITVNEDSANATAVTLGLSSVTYAPGGGTDESGQTLTYTITAIPAFVTLYKSDGTTQVSVSGTVTASELQGLKYKTVADGNGTGNITWTVVDSGGTANTGVNTLTEDLSMTVTSVNDAPTLTATTSTPTYTETGAAVSVFSASALSTVEAGQTIDQVVFTVSGLADGASEIIVINGTDVALTNGTSGNTATNTIAYTVSVTGTTATVTLTKSDTAANWQGYVNAFTYKDTGTGAGLTTGNRVVTLTSVKDNGGTASSGVDTTTVSVASTVTVAAINHAPTLSTTTSTPTFTEGGAAASLFSATTVGIGSPDTAQTITQLVLTVTNVTDGASEILSVDGSDVTLANATSVTTTTNSMTAGVAVAGSTATVTISKAGGISAAAMQTLVNGLTYKNSSSNPSVGSSRVVTLTQVKDNGGTTGGGVDTTTLSSASTVSLVAVNNAPTNIVLSAASVSTFDSGNVTVGTLTPADVDNTAWTYTITAVKDPSNNAVTNTNGAVFDLGAAGSSSAASAATATLRAVSPSSLTTGNYTITVQVDDGGTSGTYSKDFIVTVDSSLVVDVTAIDSNAPTGVYATDSTDNGGLDLKEALNFANNASGPITIRFKDTLNGTITLPGNLTVRDGVTLKMDSDTDSRTLIISTNGFVLAGALTGDVGTGDTLTINSDLTDDGSVTSSLTKTGAGTLVLGGTNNTSTGGATGIGINTISLTAGTLSVGADANLGTGTLTLNGGIFNVNNAGTIDNAITLGASNGTINVTNGVSTLSGNITGTGSLIKTGGQLLTLSGTNDYSGGTTISGANGVSVAGSANLGTGSVTLNTKLTVTSATTISNAITVNNDAAIISNANAVTLSGVLSGSNTLTKAGAGTLTLSGSNTHTGAVTVSAGGLTLTGGSSIGDSSAVTLDSGTTLTLNGGNETIGSLAGDGNVILSYRLTAGGDNSSTVFSGAISSTNTSGLTKTGSGTLTLTGSNIYTGSTSVLAGTLIADRVGGALADTTAVSVASGATFTAWTDETIGSIAGAGNVSLNSGTLTVGGDGTSTELSGVISGDGDLQKTGSGTFALSGSNTYTGSTTVSAGTLEAKNAAALGTIGVGTTVSSGAALAIQGGITLAETLTLSGSGLSGTGALVNVSGINTLSAGVTLGADSGIGTTAGSLTLSGSVSGGFALSKLGSSTLIMSATSNYTGVTTVSAGTLLVTGSLGATSGLSVASGATLAGTGSIFAASSSNNLTINSGATLAPGVAGTNNGIGRLTVNGNLRLSGGLEAELAGAGGVGGTDFDQVVVNGIVSLNGGSLSVARVGGYTAINGASYRLIDNDSTDAVTGATGIFGSVAEGGNLTSNGDIYSVSYASGTGNDVVLTTVVPITINVNGAPTGDVTISGVAIVGETLSVSNTLADADGLGSIVYTWKDGNGNILGTGPSLVLALEYLDKTIIVTASYTDGLGKVETVSSTATVAVTSGNTTNATQTVEFNTGSTGGFSGGSFTTGSQIPSNLIQPINAGLGLGSNGGAGGLSTSPGGGSGFSAGGLSGAVGGGFGGSLGGGSGGFGPSIFSSSFSDAGMSSTGTQTTSLQMEAQLDGGSSNNFTVPAEALLGLDTSTGVSFQAAQADGASLPAWVRFDSATGRLSLNEGSGERTVVKITATDGRGNQTVITVVLEPQQPGQRQNSEGRPGGQEGQGGGQGRPNQGRPTGGEPRAQLGKIPLSAQLRGFGAQGTQQDADALLENLARVFAEPRDAA
ncbi:hypothetical protein [Methylomonas albis]|nr:hypothetical protein [Methylomonas albis]